jgi:UDP-GlcNAc:undecaprenyl-phosphate/decaprenyl-phosphate GlcNAc-1-phosphate transferase
MSFLATLLVSLFVTVALIPAFSRFAVRLNLVDNPDWRKVHKEPMPRCGGIAMAFGACLSMVFWAEPSTFLLAFLAGIAVLVVFGVFDDAKSISPYWKFVGQVIAALAVIVYGGIGITNVGSLLPESVMLPPWASLPLTLIVIVGVTNAINLSDGLDGLAAGISLLGIGTIGYLAYLEGDMQTTIMSVALGGAVFGFLRFNTYPATLFMGDAGSQLLGFSTIVLALKLTQGGTALSPLLPLLILGLPVLDTAFVMVQRAREGRSIFSPDKNHFHHRLMSLGLYHTEAVATEYMIQAVLILSAFFFRFHSDWLILFSYLCFSGLVVGSLVFADHHDWRLRRYHFIDMTIKGRLKVLKDRGAFIIASFTAVKFGMPLLLIATCFLPAALPRPFGVACLVAIPFLGFSSLLSGTVGRTILVGAVYLFVPFVVYFSEIDNVLLPTSPLLRLYHLAFVAVLLFVMATLKLTRRKKGFTITPTDLLILFIILAAMLLPGAYLRTGRIGYVAAKTIMFFFSYEVLFGELRGENRLILASTIAALAITGIRGMW